MFSIFLIDCFLLFDLFLNFYENLPSVFENTLGVNPKLIVHLPGNFLPSEPLQKITISKTSVIFEITEE